MQNAKSKPLTCKSSPLVETTYADLYEDLQDFRIDESNDTAFSFTDRLARDNGWAVEYSKRVVDEYKKFMLLAVAAGHPVTPSDQVDQAWHLHLTYSRSYWQDLCNGVLRKDIHHGPTQGGAKEAIKFDHWYRNTLNTYSRFFGCPPPKDIWPDPHIRFGEDLHFRRVNTKQYWVFPRLRLLAARGESAMMVGQVRAIKWVHGNGKEKAWASKGFVDSHQRNIRPWGTPVLRGVRGTSERASL